MASIRARLTIWYSGVVVLVLIVAAVAVSLVQGSLALQRLDEDLLRSLVTLEGVMRTELNEGLVLQAAANEARAEVLVPDRTLAVADTTGRTLAVWGAPIAGSWSLPADDQAGKPVTILLGSTVVRLASRRVSYTGHHYITAVATPLAPFTTQHEELRWALIAGVVIALIIAAIGGWIVGQQTLRPLGEMARQAAHINEHTPATRLRAPDAGDELGQLATAFNGLLDRLAAALHAQRQFMADASHEMRTPVSVVRTTAQVILSRETRREEEYRESFTIVSEQSARLARLVDAMFLLSRAEAQGVPLQREAVYLDDLAAETARAFQVLANDRGIQVTTDGATEVAFNGDDGLLRQLIANLVDNAIRFAPSSGHVVISLRRTADAILLSVIDDGPGVAAADRERIFERFVRVGARSGGAGLGLSIARWIAEAHGGRLFIESSEPGRTCFTAILPERGGV
jgi:heavy metal sensor kinase